MASKRRTTYGVFVGNLPQHSSEVTVGQLFSSFGEIESIRVMETKREGVKIAFANFLSLRDAERAIRERNGYVYCGRNLNVSAATNSKNRELGGLKMGQVAVGGLPIVTREEGREEEVVLTQVESPVTFFVHLLRHRHEHFQLSRRLSEICPRQTPIASKPFFNKVYAAKFSEDCQWYRCKVVSTKFYDKSYVQYIDYGNQELVSHSLLVDLPHDLSTLPPLALRCRLSDLVSVDPVLYPAAYREGVDFLQTHLREKIVVVRLQSRPDDTFEIARLVLGDVDLHRQLLRLGYVTRLSSDLPTVFVAPAKPPLESMNGFPSPDMLQAKLEELELQLGQERGKVKAVTAEVDRLNKESTKRDTVCSVEKIQLKTLLDDLERVCRLRRQIPVLPGDPDYLEDAIQIYQDQDPVELVENRNNKIRRVVEGVREVYGNLLRTRNLASESFPVAELAAYYRRLKRDRQRKCLPLASETDAARDAMAAASGTLAQAVVSGKSLPCAFDEALERLRQCLARELTAVSLESSDVAVLTVMASILESALSRQLREQEVLY